MFCAYCGINLADDARFCSNCGHARNPTAFAGTSSSPAAVPREAYQPGDPAQPYVIPQSPVAYPPYTSIEAQPYPAPAAPPANTGVITGLGWVLTTIGALIFLLFVLVAATNRTNREIVVGSILFMGVSAFSFATGIGLILRRKFGAYLTFCCFGVNAVLGGLTLLGFLVKHDPDIAFVAVGFFFSALLWGLFSLYIGRRMADFR